jgi:hypothetical protein
VLDDVHLLADRRAAPDVATALGYDIPAALGEPDGP